MAKQRSKRPEVAPLGQIGVRYEGLERDRVYTRDDICRHFGYNLEGMSPEVRANAVRNLDRYFKRNFLDRGLPALPVGKTYLVSGESLWLWVTANATRIQQPDSAK